MHGAIKLLTGLAATVILARAAAMHQGPAIIATLGNSAATVLMAHGVTDGSVSFRGSYGIVSRVARLSGTADAATRAAIIAEVKRHPGISDAVWSPR